eukprot:2185473-Pleurochrysis_carterae.AAC.1
MQRKYMRRLRWHTYVCLLAGACVSWASAHAACFADSTAESAYIAQRSAARGRGSGAATTFCSAP